MSEEQMYPLQEFTLRERLEVDRFDLFEAPPFVVHIYGPDDVEEFDTWLEAVIYATAWNAAHVEYVTRRLADEGVEPETLTRSWATPYTRNAAIDAGVIR